MKCDRSGECVGCPLAVVIKNGEAYDDGNGVSVHFGDPIVIKYCGGKTEIVDATEVGHQNSEQPAN